MVLASVIPLALLCQKVPWAYFLIHFDEFANVDIEGVIPIHLLICSYNDALNEKVLAGFLPLPTKWCNFCQSLGDIIYLGK